MANILLVPECGPGVGLGHLERMLALADRLHGGVELVLPDDDEVVERARRRGHAVTTHRGDLLERVAQVESRGRCLVVDAYTFPREAQRRVRANAPLVVVDDLGQPSACDLAVNPAPGGEAMRPSGARRFLGGARYALMSAAYLDARRAREVSPPPPGSVLISTGATDADGLGTALASRLVSVRDVRVTLVRGNGWPVAALPSVVEVVDQPQSLARLIATHAVFCGAAGTSAVQAAMVGTPAVITAAFDNQLAQAHALAAAGAAVNVDRDAMAAAVERLLDDDAALRAMSAAGRSLVDGRGAERVADAMSTLVPAEILR